MSNLITLQEAVKNIKDIIELSITHNGIEGKNNLIRTQKPIKLLHEVVKSELIKFGIEDNLIKPELGSGYGELKLSGFFKRKAQDICIIPKKIKEKIEILSLNGLLYGETDIYGKNYTEKTISINVRSQLSSSAKNFDTLYERTFAEALNLHLRCPKMVLGELYMIPAREIDSAYAKNNIISYKMTKGINKQIEKYILSFDALNNRSDMKKEFYKYEKVCLLIVDFSYEKPKIYNNTEDLIKDNLIPYTSKAKIEQLSFTNFIKDLLSIYHSRF